MLMQSGPWSEPPLSTTNSSLALHCSGVLDPLPSYTASESREDGQGVGAGCRLYVESRGQAGGQAFAGSVMLQLRRRSAVPTGRQARRPGGRWRPYRTFMPSSCVCIAACVSLAFLRIFKMGRWLTHWPACVPARRSERWESGAWRRSSLPSAAAAKDAVSARPASLRLCSPQKGLLAPLLGLAIWSACLRTMKIPGQPPPPP